jgi:hypothetical protein
MAAQQAAEVMELYRRVLAGESLFPGPRSRRVPFAGTVATDPEKPKPRKTEYALKQLARSGRDAG